MNVWTRPALDADREKFVWVEKGAIKGLAYVNDVWDLFTKNNDGEFTAAFLNDELGGIGKLTRLYNGYGWLEALRVHPNYQGKGLGKAIYKRYMEQMEEMGLSAVGMYTGYENVVSRSLAEKFGLSVKQRFSEYTCANLPVGTDNLDGFYRVDINDGERVLSAHYDEMGGFAVVNRTFYPVKEGLGKLFSSNGWLYKDNYGNIIVAGSRFQPEKALHISFMSGDSAKLLNFAAVLAYEQGACTMSAIRAFDDKVQNDILLGNGFIKSGVDLITLWKDL